MSRLPGKIFSTWLQNKYISDQIFKRIGATKMATTQAHFSTKEGDGYGPSGSSDLEPDIGQKYERAKRRFTYFWKSHDVFSQWHKSKFSADGIKFVCAEQYIIYQKAILFGSDDIAKQILKTNDPATMKELGRNVRQYDENKWRCHCLDIVKKASICKYSQNSKMKEELFETYPTVLVNANPSDRIWGIGLDEKDERAWDESTWQGLNILGRILTEVRDEFMYKERHITKESRRIFTPDLQEKLFRLSAEMRLGTDVDRADGDQD